ncbi:hypothetical protein [Acinetobacter soli]|uniref:hypothetical protein n=1 Tax=Acinetobacter soli TaxID=487316 RepID=UPI0032B4B0F4
MAQLINKGGFRERANRSRGYQQSENRQTALLPNKYQPNHGTEASSLTLDQETSTKTDDNKKAE